MDAVPLAPAPSRILDRAGDVARAMDACRPIFDSWAEEREPGVFCASSAVSSERGPAAYDMGHGLGNNRFVATAVREMVQNSRDAGAKSIEVDVRAVDGAAVACVTDDAPDATRLSLRLFTDVFLTMDASSKPVGAAGGKGQARVMLSGLDGLAMFGGGGFAAVVGVKYAAALDAASDLVTYRAATPAHREELERALRAAPRVEGAGGAVAVRVRGAGAGLKEQLQLLLSLCDHQSLGLSFRFEGERVPLRDAAPMAEASAHRPKVDVAFKLLPKSWGGHVYGKSDEPKNVLTHVRCCGIVMFTKHNLEVHDVYNSDRLQLVIDVSAKPGVAHAALFSTQRNALDAAALGCEAADLVRAAAKEFEVRRPAAPADAAARASTRPLPRRGRCTSPHGRSCTARRRARRCWPACRRAC